MQKKKQHNKFIIVSMITLLAVLALFGCQSTSSGDTEDKASSKDKTSSEANSQLLNSKPDVAEVKANNNPNRIITTFNGDTQTQMGFN